MSRADPFRHTSISSAIGNTLMGVETALGGVAAYKGMAIRNAVQDAGDLVAAPKKIVIGENMDRVRPYAKEIGAEIYEGMPGYKPGMEEEGLLHNKQVIQQKMSEGYQIIDIGPDFPRRAVRGAPQPGYQMERTITKGYKGYQKAFIRNSKDSLILLEP
jgi:hypothetical protein